MSFWQKLKLEWPEQGSNLQPLELISSALGSSAFHYLESKKSKPKNERFCKQACANIDFHKMVTEAILNMAIRDWRVLFLC